MLRQGCTGLSTRLGLCNYGGLIDTSRCLGWRIHGSVEDTKLSTNKQHSLSRFLLMLKESLKAPLFTDGFRLSDLLCQSYPDHTPHMYGLELSDCLRKNLTYSDRA